MWRVGAVLLGVAVGLLLGAAFGPAEHELPAHYVTTGGTP